MRAGLLALKCTLELTLVRLVVLVALVVWPGHAGARPEGEQPTPDRSSGRSHSPRAAKSRGKKLPGRLDKDSNRSLSIGSPTAGKLQKGVKLVESDALRLRAPDRGRWGVPELVRLLERSSKRVRSRFGGSVVLVGDLSRRNGGWIAGHRSHTSGRDADVGFYFVDAKGKPKRVAHFLSVTASGRAAERPELSFDDKRNWALVQAWLTDPDTRVQHIFVAKPLRARLLAYARKRGVSAALVRRAALAMKQPSRGLSHDDHFHVRIACPAGQQKVCISEPKPRPRKNNKKKRRRASPDLRALVDPAGSVNNRRS